MPAKSIERRRETNRQHYARNKAKVYAKTAAYKKLSKTKWAEYKATLACVKCGQNHPATLDFHHVIRLPTNRKIYELAASGAWKIMVEELKKCIVLCANCHRIHHHEERETEKLVFKGRKYKKTKQKELDVPLASN
jgi:hypothetical protein